MILIGIIAALIVIIAVVMPNPRETRQVASAPVASADDSLVEVHSWLAMSAGHYVTCTIYKNGGRDYILMPSTEEMQSGAQPTVNSAPSDDSWSDACSQVVKTYK